MLKALFYRPDFIGRDQQVDDFLTDDFNPDDNLPQSPEEAFIIYRLIGGGGSEPFRWQTNRGEILTPEEMATMHLFYAIRMMWNNKVPPAFRVGKFKRYKEVQGWTKEYVEDASQALCDELNRREDDLDDEVTDSDTGETIRQQFADISANAEFLKLVGYKIA